MLGSIQDIFSKKIISAEPAEIENSVSINGMVAKNGGSVSGLKLTFESGEELDAAVKEKSRNLLKNGINLVGECDPMLKLELILHNKILGYQKSVRREIAVYERADKELRDRMINYFGTFQKRRGGHEYMVFQRYDSQKPDMSLEGHKVALDAILPFHRRYYNDLSAARDMCLNVNTPEDYRRSKRCLNMLFHVFDEENLRVFGPDTVKAIDSFIDDIDARAAEFAFHRSFSHNDFSTRNMILSGDSVLLYDFELSSFQNPEHDLIELLIFDSAQLTDKEMVSLTEYYRRGLYDGLEQAKPVDDQMYLSILRFNLCEWIVNRLSLLRIVGRKLDIDYIDGLLENAKRLTELFEVKNGS